MLRSRHPLVCLDRVCLRTISIISLSILRAMACKLSNKIIYPAVIFVAALVSIGTLAYAGTDGKRAAIGGGPSPCSAGDGGYKVTIRHGSAPGHLTSVLGILRRPGTKEETLPSSALAQMRFAAIWIDNVRVVHSHHTWRLVLVPGVVASDCATLGQRPLAIGVATYEGRSLVGVSTYRISDIVRGRAIQVRPAGANALMVSGIVSDDIHAVKISVSDGPVTTVGVKNNYFDAEVKAMNDPTSGRGYEVRLDLVGQEDEIVRSITKVVQRGGFSGSFSG